MVSYEYPTGIQRTRSGEHRNTQAAWPGLKETSNTQDFNALLRLDLHVEGPTCRPTLAQPRYHCFSRYRPILLVAPLLTDFYTAQISEYLSPKQRFDILASYNQNFEFQKPHRHLPRYVRARNVKAYTGASMLLLFWRLRNQPLDVSQI